MKTKEATPKQKAFKPVKRVPAEYQPNDRTLMAVRKYADTQGITSTRVYQKFQEGLINIVKIDGVQFVELKKS